MPSHVALLRAINLAGKNMVRMSELCALFGEEGFPNAKSLLNSGNVVFDGGARDSAAIEKKLELATAKRLGVSTDFMVRTAAQWKKLVSANPFAREAKDDPGRLVAFVLKTTPARGAEAHLTEAIRGREYARVIGSCAYIVFPDGQGRSKLTPAVIERALGARGTARNWNTVLKLLTVLGGGRDVD
jgi:uncharacterized protein (DUF1697 family)